MKVIHPLLLVAVSLSFIFGCAKTKYLESETPAGRVPPPPAPAALPPIVPQAPSPQQTSAPASSASFVSDAAGMRAEVRGAEATVSEGTMQRFKQSYSEANHPRITVFLNRELSDEVREWATDSRLVLAGGYMETKTADGQSEEQTEVIGGISGYVQEGVDDGKRLNPSEQWMWAFEDGFVQPFLQSSATIVDRATILRLTAVAPEHRDSAYAPISAKRVETSALQGYADVFIELLISRSPSSLYGYEFKASAKEVETGRLIANVTSLRWRPEDHKQREVYATHQGYKVADSTKIPPVDEIASLLAADLMNALSRAWE